MTDFACTKCGGIFQEGELFAYRTSAQRKRRWHIGCLTNKLISDFEDKLVREGLPRSYVESRYQDNVRWAEKMIKEFYTVEKTPKFSEARKRRAEGRNPAREVVSLTKAEFEAAKKRCYPKVSKEVRDRAWEMGLVV